MTTARTTVRRLPDRGSTDREVVDAILDEALVCHLGLQAEHGPVVIPTLFVRIGDEIYLHGAPANAMLRSLRSGVDACCTVTLVDGLVLARSAFHPSVNYRSVVVFGQAREVEDAVLKRTVLDALVEKVMPGRSGEARGPTDKELRATLMVSMRLDEVSAKIRRGPPVDDDEDYALPVWAGVLPLQTTAGPPLPDGELPAGARSPELLDGVWRSGAPGSTPETPGTPGGVDI